MSTEKKTEKHEVTPESLTSEPEARATDSVKKAKKSSPDQLTVWRFIVPVVLAMAFALIAVVAVYNTNGSIKSHNYSGSEAAQSVQEDFVLNEAGSDTVYQQQVSAQWAIKDMVKVVADQTGGLSQMSADLIKAQSTMLTVLGLIAGLLMVIVGLLAIIGANLIKLSKKK